MKTSLTTAAMAALILSSCAGTGKSSQETTAPADGATTPAPITGYWYIDDVVASDTLSVRPADIDPDNPQYVAFMPDSTYAFTTNCNSISGSYTVNGDSIKLDGFMQTRMACPDMTVEQLLALVLPQVSTIQAVNDSVVRLATSDPSMYIMLRHSATDPGEQGVTEIIRM